MNTNNSQQIPPDEQPLLPFDPPLEFDPPTTSVPQTPEVAALIAENKALRQAARMRDARDEIAAAVRSAGARSPELMFEAAKDHLQFGEDDKLQNIAAVVGKLKSRFPEQFGTVVPQPPIDGGAGASHAASALTKETLSRMKPADIARLNWDDVRQILST